MKSALTTTARTPRILPKKTCQLLKNDTVHRVTGAERRVRWVFLQIAYRLEARGVNQ